MLRIGFLHTSPVHTETFKALVGELGESIETVTVVDESLLDLARFGGAASDQVRDGIGFALDRLEEAGCSVVVCTCSTIAGQAELDGMRRSIGVLRVDRPMAEAAIAAGTRITVIAALESTVGPTTELISQVATQAKRDVDVSVRICAGAWSCFEKGDIEGYIAKVVETCEAAAESSDVIVLAQASMAAAAARCDVNVPVLSSPGLAVEAALRSLR